MAILVISATESATRNNTRKILCGILIEVLVGGGQMNKEIPCTLAPIQQVQRLRGSSEHGIFMDISVISGLGMAINVY